MKGGNCSREFLVRGGMLGDFGGWRWGWLLATGCWLFVVGLCLEVFEEKRLAAGGSISKPQSGEIFVERRNQPRPSGAICMSLKDRHFNAPQFNQTANISDFILFYFLILSNFPYSFFLLRLMFFADTSCIL